MPQFDNAKATSFTNAIEGLFDSLGGAQTRLDSNPQIKVVCDTDWGGFKVRLIADSRLRHVLKHAGSVGADILKGAARGKAFTPSSFGAELASLLAVLDHTAYTPSTISFGKTDPDANTVMLRHEGFARAT